MVISNRVVLVDALRGFALVGIVLIHCVEHFDFFYDTEINFLFSKDVDEKIMQAIFFLISGKAYSIFALMFGFSFYIQMKRQEERGFDFRWKFLWRLTILLVFGFLHSLVYKGDILHIYALLGIPLVFLDRLSTKKLMWIAIILALQIPSIYQLVISLVNPQVEFTGPFQYWPGGNEAFAHGSLWEVVRFNLWKGRANVWNWTYSNGRYLQLIALFVVGIIFGRNKYFEEIGKYRKSLVHLLIISIVSATVIFILRNSLWTWNIGSAQKEILGRILHSYSALASTGIVLFSFIIFYLKFEKFAWVKLFADYGKMSLTNYVLQALKGVVFFFGFGLGMYRYMGSGWSLLYGIIFVYLQLMISKYWMRIYYYGPLEWLWRALTYFDFTIRFKRKPNNT